MLDLLNGCLFLSKLRFHLTELLITLVDLFLCIFIFRLVLIQLGFILAVLLCKLGKTFILLLNGGGDLVVNLIDFIDLMGSWFFLYLQLVNILFTKELSDKDVSTDSLSIFRIDEIKQGEDKTYLLLDILDVLFSELQNELNEFFLRELVLEVNVLPVVEGVMLDLVRGKQLRVGAGHI